MTDQTTQEAAESRIAEAAHTAAVATEAMAKARRADLDDAVATGLDTFFEGRKAMGRFIDINRIPFLCDDIRGLHIEIKEMRENAITKTDFELLKQKADLTNRIVFSFVGIICLGFMAALGVGIYK